MTSHPTVSTAKRTPITCSSCRKKKIKCQPSFTDSRCMRCKETDAECDFAFFPVISGQTSILPYTQQSRLEHSMDTDTKLSDPDLKDDSSKSAQKYSTLSDPSNHAAIAGGSFNSLSSDNRSGSHTSISHSSAGSQVVFQDVQHPKKKLGYKNIPSLDAITARLTIMRASQLSVDGSTTPPEPEMIEDPKTSGVPMKAPEHPLQFPWTIYHDSKATFPFTPATAAPGHDFNQPARGTNSPSVPLTEPPLSAAHPPESTEYEAGLTVIGEFNTVEESCRYFNWLKPPSKLEKNSNYHIFKSGIKPMWEDPANANGGKWVLTMKNNLALLDRCWSWLTRALVGEELEDEEEICGAVVSLRSDGARIQVWTRSKDDVDKLNGIGERLVKLLDVSEADNIGLEFQFNSDDRPPPNIYLSIQLTPASSFRPSFQTSSASGPSIKPALLPEDADYNDSYATKRMPQQTYKYDTDPSSSQGESALSSENSGSATQKFEQKNATTYWFAAEHAHQHAVSYEVQIAAEFNRYGIQEHQYAVYAGFDEFLIKNGGGYLEQIHVMSSVSLGGSDHSSLFSNLGRIFSPFSALLFTPSSVHEIPVYKDNGSTWELDEFIYSTAKQFDIVAGVPPCSASGAPPDPCHCPPVISLSHSPSGNSSSSATSTPADDNAGDAPTRQKGKGKKADKSKKDDGMQDEEEGMDGDPESDPESDPDQYTDPEAMREGRVVINLVSEIYSNHQRMKESKQGDFQRLSMRGAFSVRASKEDSKTPSVDVKFTDLRFGNERKAGNTAYHQYHLRVEIASGSQTADITGISPRRTSAFDRAVKDSSTLKTIRGGGLSFACGMKGIEPSVTVGVNGTMSNERSYGVERTRFLDQIAETSCDGSTRWDFTIDDPTAQAGGIHLPDDRLPAVNFRFPATPLPNRVSAAIVSFWSLITPEGRSQSWISKLFYGAASLESNNMPAYSNLCQAATVALSPRLKGEYQHKTKLYVNSGNAALDYHARTEWISPLTSDVDVNTDITNARCPSGSPGVRVKLGASLAMESDY